MRKYISYVLFFIIGNSMQYQISECLQRNTYVPRYKPFAYSISSMRASTPMIKNRPASVMGCDPYNVHILYTFKTRYCTHIAVLKDKYDKKFLVKQETRKVLSRHFAVICEKLGASIAESADIIANHVDIVPAHCAFPGKMHSSFPATLHEFVPGISSHALPKESRVFIKQTHKVATPKEKQGLIRRVITDMSRHEDLCKMVALDTFIANADRHKGNFFYDKKSDRFIAIDLESAFGKNLAKCACRCIQSLLDAPKDQLSIAEIAGLRLYRDTLRILLQLHTPKSMYNQLVDFSYEAGLLSRPVSLSMVRRLKWYEKMIIENYNSCKELVVLLDQLLER